MKEPRALSADIVQSYGDLVEAPSSGVAATVASRCCLGNVAEWRTIRGSRLARSSPRRGPAAAGAGITIVLSPTDPNSLDRDMHGNLRAERTVSHRCSHLAWFA
jgi:hypothetical protein